MVMKKKLTRSNNRMIAGVCAGIAEYFDLDVSLVRLGYVLISILSAAFPGILVYLAAWFIMPEDDSF
jgi:phage shock protein C